MCILGCCNADFIISCWRSGLGLLGSLSIPVLLGHRGIFLLHFSDSHVGSLGSVLDVPTLTTQVLGEKHSF